MPQTKLIYGVGRVPRASEFALGEIIVNVDDSKVYSKNKLNVVFEITGTGGGGSQLPGGDTIINEGDDVTINVTSQQAFATASVSGSGFFTSVDVASNLIISGGGGISVTTGSGNQLFITTGSSFTVATASFVQTAQTASYVSSFNINGGLFTLESGDTQGQIIFSDSIVDVDDLITAQATNLSPSSDVEFRNITSSAGISASSDVFAKRLRLPSGQNTAVAGIIFDEQAGNSGFIYDDGTGLQLGYNDIDLITVSSSNDVKVRVAGNTLISNGYLNISNGYLNVESNITASGNISSSGNVKAYKYLLRGNELAQITTVDGIANTITIGDSTNQNQLNFVGSNIRTAVDFTSSANISASGFISASDGTFKSVNIITNPTTTDGINYPFIVSAKENTNIDLDPGHGVGIKFKIAGGNDPLYSEEGASIAAIKENTSDTNTSTGLGFFTTLDGSNLVERLRISKDGRVGIGMTPGFYSQSLTVVGGISASGALFASASQPAAHSGSILAVVYDTGSGRFYYTGSYGAGGGSGDDGDWLIDTVNSKLTASLDLLLTSSNQNQYIYFNSGNVNDVSNLKRAYISNTISDTIYGQEIKLENYYNEGLIELAIGDDPYVIAKKSGVTAPAVIINDDAKDIDFNVKGDTDTSLIYANAGTDKVGIGYNNPGQKLSVNGNIYSNGYLELQGKANLAGVAGALLYSSSNEFYLGFSS